MARAVDQPAESLEFFESRIRPVLIEYCYECHNSQQREGGLALDSRAGLRAGGDRQRELAASERGRNLFLEAIRHEHDDLKMPEGGAKLSADTIADFEKWFAAGAVDPRDRPPDAEALQPEKLRELVFRQRAKWWALQPLSTTAPPRIDAADWPEQWRPAGRDHPIDRFVLSAMREHGLEPSPPATPAELLRRLNFALVGLPPSPEELAEVERAAQTSPAESAAAIDRAIQRLLASPHFGERWARHWMDWIRYAESHGSEGDPPIPYASQYRDYLIRALNQDVPYDRLVQEHLAGDLLPEPRVNDALGINESAIGPAHLRMVFHGFAPTDAMEEKVRFVDDQLGTLSKAFLGLTVACARCHDHKFDAISQADYYALFGILGSCHPGIVDANTPQRQRAHQADLLRLKSEIQREVADQWLASVDKIFERLLAPEPDLEQAMLQAKRADQTLYLWQQLLESRATLARPSSSFRKTLADYLEAAHRHDEQHEQQRAQAHPQPGVLELERWFSHGNGSADRPVAAGAFTIALSGPRAIQAIFPAGRYSHLLSTRHRNVVLSPRIELGDDTQLWLQVAGDGDASVRYAVEDYPRNGTVYPVTPLGGGAWRWQQYDLDYWQGDSIHVELATAGDAPVLARNTERSWFGIRDARLVLKGQAAPESGDREPFFVLARTFAQAQPTTLDELRECWSQALRAAIKAWTDGTATDEQAMWLNDWLQARLLPEVSSPLVEQYRQLEADIPLPTRVPGVWETVGRDQPLLVRGDHHQPGAAVPRRFLFALDDQPYRAAGSGRLELARSLLGPGRALTARVIVNRLWHHLFGRGLVATPDNFGKLGQAPTHPELLDYLAQDLIDNGWSLKHTLALIVRSQTWQQSSHANPESRALDPENLWLARAPLRRLEAEAIRDAQLLVSGRLDATMFGTSVAGTEPRRSLYVRVHRNSLDPQLRAFDFPEPTSTIGRRDVTNVPAQSLMLLNNAQVRSLARAWGEKVLEQSQRLGETVAIDGMFRWAFGRSPAEGERAEVRARQSRLQEQWHALDRRRAELTAQAAEYRRERAALFAPLRDRQKNNSSEPQLEIPVPTPLASWDFERAAEAVSNLDGAVVGQATITGGVLETQGGFYRSAPLPFSLSAKTLEAWIEVDDLGQRGGGVMSIQSNDGAIFDAIVLGEQKPGHWLSGSNHFARTQPFDGPAETAAGRTIHLAISYASDGQIAAYRNGQPYGKPYKSSGLHAFEAGQTRVTLGCRHLPAGGNKMLKARWRRAALYGTALSAQEVAASYRKQPQTPSQQERLDLLEPSQRASVARLETQLSKTRAQLDALGEASEDSAALRAWTDVALALLSAKEFLFVK